MSPSFSLTARQQQVLALHCMGKTYLEIAHALRISPQTVKNHLTLIYRIMRVSGGFEACTRYGMAVARERSTDGDRALRPEAV